MDGSGHNGLQDWTPVIVEEVNLVLREDSVGRKRGGAGRIQ